MVDIASLPPASDEKQFVERLTNSIVRAMEFRDLSLAGELASALAILQRGSEWCPPGAGGRSPSGVDTQLSLAKLRHDSDQLRYLRAIGVLDNRFDAVIRAYEETILGFHGRHDARRPLSTADPADLRRAYGRIVHLRDAPRLPASLSPAWSREDAQRRYLDPPGVVVIDDFLTPEALDSLYRFCLESTVWTGNRYANGRLGAFFFAGFNCPLLLQLAEEVRDAFPTVIGSYPLRQLWGFKNTSELPAHTTIHADFAAVNVNCWITPTSANLDESSGGMVIYGVDAPSAWDFATYNESIDLIREYLTTRRARAIRVPYRQNRAIIFNSDLFHATEGVRFKPDYASHRVNITLLYGERQRDRHHPLSPSVESPNNATTSACRSAAFSRSRR